jgi:hypothetical protein
VDLPIWDNPDFATTCYILNLPITRPTNQTAKTTAQAITVEHNTRNLSFKQLRTVRGRLSIASPTQKQLDVCLRLIRPPQKRERYSVVNLSPLIATSSWRGAIWNHERCGIARYLYRRQAAIKQWQPLGCSKRTVEERATMRPPQPVDAQVPSFSYSDLHIRRPIRQTAIRVACASSSASRA